MLVLPVVVPTVDTLGVPSCGVRVAGLLFLLIAVVANSTFDTEGVLPESVEVARVVNLEVPCVRPKVVAEVPADCACDVFCIPEVLPTAEVASGSF